MTGFVDYLVIRLNSPVRCRNRICHCALLCSTPLPLTQHPVDTVIHSKPAEPLDNPAKLSANPKNPQRNHKNQPLVTGF